MVPTPTMKMTAGKATGYFLFIDIVGYSRLTFAGQQSAQEQLQHIVERCPDYIEGHRSRRLIARPTGDGMVLAFFDKIEQPLRCAIDVDAGLKNLRIAKKATFHVRMGVHSGPTAMTHDINGAWDVAGPAIVMAQRVMNCGDRDHILVSGEVGDELVRRQDWRAYLRYIGPCKIKHEQTVRLYTLRGTLPTGQEFGTELTPKAVFASQGLLPAAPRDWGVRPSPGEDVGNRFLRYMGLAVLFLVALSLGHFTGTPKGQKVLASWMSIYARESQPAQKTASKSKPVKTRPRPVVKPAPRKKKPAPSSSGTPIFGSRPAPGKKSRPTEEPFIPFYVGEESEPKPSSAASEARHSEPLPVAKSEPVVEKPTTGVGTQGQVIPYEKTESGLQIKGPGE